MSSPFQLKVENSYVPANTTSYPAMSVVTTDFAGVSSLQIFPYYAQIVKLDSSSSTGAAPVNSAVWSALSVSTDSTGTNWVQFPSNVATICDIINTTGTILHIKNNSGTVYLPLPDNASVQISVVANTSEIAIKRADSSNTQVNVFGLFHKY